MTPTGRESRISVFPASNVITLIIQNAPLRRRRQPASGCCYTVRRRRRQRTQRSRRTDFSQQDRRSPQRQILRRVTLDRLFEPWWKGIEVRALTDNGAETLAPVALPS